MSHEPMTADEVKAAFEELDLEEGGSLCASGRLVAEWKAGRIGSLDGPRKCVLEWRRSPGDGLLESLCRPEAITAIETVFLSFPGPTYDLVEMAAALSKLELTDSEWTAAAFSLGFWAARSKPVES